MACWVSRRLTLIELRVWLAVWVVFPSELIQMLFNLRHWGVWEPTVVLLTPIRDGNNVFAWMHVVSIDAGIAQNFTQWTWTEPIFVGSLW